MRREWRKSLAAGLLQIAAYGLVIWAMSVAAMASVSALRETSVIFAALIASAMLRERLGPVRVGAVLAVASGVVLLKLGS